MHADLCIYLVDASLDDLLFIRVRVRAEAALQEGPRAFQGKDIQTRFFLIHLGRTEIANFVRLNVADRISNVFIAGAASLERGIQLWNAFLTIRHIICLV